MELHSKDVGHMSDSSRIDCGWSRSAGWTHVFLQGMEAESQLKLPIFDGLEEHWPRVGPSSCAQSSVVNT